MKHKNQMMKSYLRLAFYFLRSIAEDSALIRSYKRLSLKQLEDLSDLEKLTYD